MSNYYSEEDKRKIEAWLQKHNIAARIQEYTAQQATKAEVLNKKRELYKTGYTQQISLYYTYRDKLTGKLTHSRLEILSREPFTAGDTIRLHALFAKMIIPLPYTLWVYSAKDDTLEMVASGETA
jgi:hypothetical protein